MKVAGIETDYNGNQINLTLLKNWCNANNVPYIGINANNDYNLETNKLRQNYYP